MLIIVFGAAVLLAVDTLWWFRTQQFLDAATRRLLEHIDAAAWHATATAGHRAGWPWSARLVLQQPMIEKRGALSWRCEGVIAEASALHPDVITFGVYGTQTLRLQVSGALPLSLRLWDSSFDAAWRRREPRTLSFSADAAHVALSGLGPDDTIQVAALLGTADTAPGGFHIHLSMRDVAFPALLGRAGSRVVPSADVSVLLPDPAADHTLASSATNDQPVKKQIVVEKVTADWGNASADLSGRAMLGADGAPVGHFVLAMRNPDTILARIREAGLITDAQQVAMRAVVAVVGAGRRDGPANQSGSIRLNLSLEHGVLLLGHIPLLRLPAISMVF